MDPEDQDTDENVPVAIKPFALTMVGGFIVPMITAILSVISSSLILHIIRKSQIKLSSTHHRIMASMSIFDIITSVPFALGTIMMPADNPFPFEGPMLGNKLTCQIQSWLVLFGSMAGGGMFISLCVYYVSVLTLKVDTDRIQKCFEPIMYVGTLLFALVVSIYYLAKDLLHPDPTYSYCTIAPYPDSCEQPAWNFLACTWESSGQLDSNYFLNDLRPLGYTLTVLFGLVFVLMLIIIWTVYDNQKKITRASANAAAHSAASAHRPNFRSSFADDDGVELGEEDDTASTDMDLSQLRYSRVIVRQALMYIFAFWITWSWNLFRRGYGTYKYTMNMLNVILFPMAGFWNMIIFVYDKAYLIYQNDGRRSYWNSVKQVVFSPENIPVILIGKGNEFILPPKYDTPSSEQSNENEVSIPPELYDGLSAGYSKYGSNSGIISGMSKSANVERISPISKPSTRKFYGNKYPPKYDHTTVEEPLHQNKLSQSALSVDSSFVPSELYDGLSVGFSQSGSNAEITSGMSELKSAQAERVAVVVPSKSPRKFYFSKGDDIPSPSKYGDTTVNEILHAKDHSAVESGVDSSSVSPELYDGLSVGFSQSGSNPEIMSGMSKLSESEKVQPSKSTRKFYDVTKRNDFLPPSKSDKPVDEKAKP